MIKKWFTWSASVVNEMGIVDWLAASVFLYGFVAGERGSASVCVCVCLSLSLSGPTLARPCLAYRKDIAKCSAFCSSLIHTHAIINSDVVVINLLHIEGSSLLLSSSSLIKLKEMGTLKDCTVGEKSCMMKRLLIWCNNEKIWFASELYPSCMQALNLSIIWVILIIILTLNLPNQWQSLIIRVLRAYSLEYYFFSAIFVVILF